MKARARARAKVSETDYSRFIDSDDEWGSFRVPLIEEVLASSKTPKQDSLNSRIDALRDRLKQK